MECGGGRGGRAAGGGMRDWRGAVAGLSWAGLDRLALPLGPAARLVLVNPATSFNRSLSGLSSLIAATNLLAMFPPNWYALAQVRRQRGG